APSLSATVADDSATVSWEAPDDGGSALTGYVVELWNGSEWVPHASLEADATSVALEALAAGEHRVRVAATNANGRGPWGEVAFTIEGEGEDPVKEEPKTPGKGGFLDTGNTTFEAEIAWLADMGITKGCNPPANDRFCPEALVTRGEIA